MRATKNDLPSKIEAPGASVRQQTGFGDATGYGIMGGEHYRLAAGTDITPLLRGLEDDLCQSPHWGYLIEGQLTVSFKGGQAEETRAGDLFYWPPGHTVRSDTDSEFVLFSPQREHSAVLDHLNKQLKA